MTLDAPVRLAIIGCGSISKQHAKAVLAHADVQCVALCDVDRDRLRERSAELRAEIPQFTDWREMLRVAGELIDAVVICLPHALHARAILDCAAAGKHVLCEKPLCTRLEEADEIDAAVRNGGIVFMAGHNQLFAPMVQAIRARLEAGEIGALRWLRSQDCFLHPPGLEGTWRARRETQGGGELIDTGYHPTYTMLHFAAARVVRVRATMARFAQPIEGEDTASLQLRFENGVIGEILTSWAFARPHGTHKIHLIGSDGQLFGTDNVLFRLSSEAEAPERIELPKVHTQTAQLARFRDCIRGTALPLHGVAESREVLRIITEAMADARRDARSRVDAR